MNAPVRVPPTIYRLLGDCLGFDEAPGHRAALETALADGATDWMRLIAYANDTRLTPTLWRRLRDRDLLGCLPADVAAYLADMAELNRERQASLKAQGHELVAALNARGIVPLALKTAPDLMSLDEPPDILSNDLDFAVFPDQEALCVDVMQAIGYAWLGSEGPFSIGDFTRGRDMGAIDLHRELLNVPGLLPMARAWQRAIEIEVDGVRFRRLGEEDEILHLIFHDQIQDVLHFKGRVNLRNLYRLAGFLAGRQTSVDWHALYDAMARAGFPNAFVTHLMAAGDLFHAPLPSFIGPSLLQTLMHRRRLAQMQFWLADGLGWRAGLRLWQFLMLFRKTGLSS